MGNNSWSVVRIKREWVPEWLFRIFCWRDIACYWPLRQVLTREVDELSLWRVNRGPI